MTALPLGSGGEFDRIRRIALVLGDRARDLGDDVARIPDQPGTLVTSVDQCIEGVHFRTEWIGFEEIGWKAAMAALSDLAASGARCVGLLVAVTAPPDSPPESLERLLDGVGEAGAASGGLVLGGDLAAASRWAVTTTVFGRATRPMSRRGARPGDTIWVTGSLGGARAAVSAWRAGRDPDQYTRAAFARPRARIAAGEWLAESGATAMIDLSDGLAGDAAHLAAASGVEIAIELDRLPVLPEVLPEARAARLAAEVFAASGGEDYELLAALPPEFSLSDAERCLGDTGTRLSRVGWVNGGSGTRLTLEGRPVSVRSYDHFA